MARARTQFEEARQQGQLWSPRQLGSAVPYWIDAQARGATFSGTAVTGIPDQSKRGQSMLNGSNITFVTDAWKGLPAYLFSTSQGWAYQTTTVSASCSAFVALSVATLKSASTASGRLMSFQASGGSQDYNNTGSAAILERNSSTGLDSYFNSVTYNSITTGYDTPFIVTVENDGSGFVTRLNGAQVGSRSGPGVSFSSGIFGIGSFWGGNNSAAKYSGYVAEQIFVVGQSGTRLCELLEGYAAHRWRLTDRISPSHRYRRTPPLVGV